MRYLIIILFLVFEASSFACINGITNDGIVKKNDLNIPVNIAWTMGISRKDFNSVIDRVKKEYSPLVSAMGGRLVVKKRWRDGTVNAYAEKKGKRRIITMFGGFARHKLVTKDVFMFVACHEIAHHVGGEPLIRNVREVWASNEGQSDYYAGAKCMRRLLVNENNVEAVSKLKVPSLVQDKCAEGFGDDQNMNALCQRISMAGLGLASVFRSIRGSDEISFSTPDPKVVWRTWFLHPKPQCRLDTYFRSAICPSDHNEEISYDDLNKGLCSRIDNTEPGERPLCWYRVE